ncbi:MAG: RNA polymerase sigma factor [Saprospiraceae bacterium]
MLKKVKYSEKEMIDACVQNDRRAQEFLYRKYLPKMMQMCFRYTSDREQALDIINIGFLRVFKKIASFSFQGSFEGWIRKIIYHSVADYFKKNERYLQFLVFEERDEEAPAEALDKMYVEDILKLVDRLPPATQAVFRLYAIEGFTHVEIGKRLQISDGTSKWHLATARKKLKKMIDQNTNKRYAG